MKCLQFLIAFMLLTVAPWAEEFATLRSVSHSTQGERLRLELETSNSDPEVSAYFSTGRDRLIVEFNDTKAQARLGRKPGNKLVRSWALKPFGLNRCRLVLNLYQRPPESAITVSKLSGKKGVAVECVLSPGVKEKIALTKGVTWVREDTYLGGRWTRINRLLFNPKDPNVEVIVGLAKEKTDSREPLTSMVNRYGALAGINGGFFAGGGGALGLVFRDGRMLVPHVSRRPPRSGFGLTADGVPKFGRLAATGPKIKDLDGDDWSDVVMALGGGPRLVKNGLAKVTADLEELGPKGNDITRVAARTVVGLTRQGDLLFCTVTGYRDNHREGTKFGPLVGWLKSSGVQEAVNFDGGASVDMVVGSHIVSDGPANKSKEKPVATALLVKDKRAKTYPEAVSMGLADSRLPADGRSQTDLNIRLKDPAGNPVPDGTEVRLFSQGVLVDESKLETKNGLAQVKVKSVRRPGKGFVTLVAGPVTEKKSIDLVSGGASKLHLAEIGRKPLEEDMQTVTLKVQVVDQWGNPVSRERVDCSVDGSEVVEFITDQMGMMAVDVELPLSGGRFEVSHPTAGRVQHSIGPLQSHKFNLIGKTK